MKYALFALAIFCFSCHGRSPEDYKKEGSSIAVSIAKDLSDVKTINDLKKREQKLKKSFNRLARLMIEEQRVNKGVKRVATNAQVIDPLGSDMLMYELCRLCSDSSMRAFLEKIQQEALTKIEAYEKKYLTQKRPLSH